MTTLNLSSSDEVIPYFTNLYNSIGLEYSISKLNINEVKTIVDSVNIERLKNSPVTFTPEEMNELFIL